MTLRFGSARRRRPVGALSENSLIFKVQSHAHGAAPLTRSIWFVAALRNSKGRVFCALRGARMYDFKIDSRREPRAGAVFSDKGA